MSRIKLNSLGELDNLLQAKEDFSTFDLFYLPVDVLVPGKYQPRTNFDEGNLNELADSIKKNGIIQPLIVRKKNSKQYEIIAGERRWRAAKITGISEIPVIVRKASDDVAMAFALIENIQREELGSVDQAAALAKLVTNFSMSHGMIAEKVGISRSTVTNLIRLLSLTAEVKTLLIQKKIEVGHAKLLLSLDEETQKIIASRIVKNKLSIRATENLIKKVKRPNIKKTFKDSNNEKLQELNEILTKKLSQEVKITLNGRKRGKVEIRIDSLKDAEKLVSSFKG